MIRDKIYLYTYLDTIRFCKDINGIILIDLIFQYTAIVNSEIGDRNCNIPAISVHSTGSVILITVVQG